MMPKTDREEFVNSIKKRIEEVMIEPYVPEHVADTIQSWLDWYELGEDDLTEHDLDDDTREVFCLFFFIETGNLYLGAEKMGEVFADVIDYFGGLNLDSIIGSGLDTLREHVAVFICVEDWLSANREELTRLRCPHCDSESYVSTPFMTLCPSCGRASGSAEKPFTFVEDFTGKIQERRKA